MSSHFHFQYQARAEPLSQDGESILLDKWWQPASEPVRRRRSPAHSFYLLPLAEYVEEETPATGCSEWTNPSTVGTGISGDVAWGSTSNVTADDGSSATATLTGFQTSEYLQVQGFGFSVPSGATIVSVEVQIDRSSVSGIANLSDVQLMKGDFGDAGSLKGDPDTFNGTAWWLTSGFGAFGGAGDTWGGYLSDLTPAIVNSADFGFAIKATNVSGSPVLSVDSMQMKVCWETETTVTMDMWWMPASEPVRQRAPLRTCEIVTAPLAIAVADQPVAMDSWFVQASEPVRSHAPRPHGGSTDPTEAANQAAATVNLDQWFQPASEPVRTKAPLRTYDKGETYESSLFGFVPSMDSWFQPASEPVRTRPPRREDWYTFPSQYLEANPPNLDMWYVRPPDMAPAHRPRPHGGHVVPFEVEATPSHHDYLLPTAQPIFARRTLPGWDGAFLVDPTAYMQSPITWWSAVVQPRFDRLAAARRIVSTTDGFFSPADWETFARSEPEVDEGGYLCGGICTLPRLTAKTCVTSRLTGTVEIVGRLEGRGIVVRCKSC